MYLICADENCMQVMICIVILLNYIIYGYLEVLMCKLRCAGNLPCDHGKLRRTKPRLMYVRKPGVVYLERQHPVCVVFYS